MLATPTILMSLGTQQGNAPQVPSGHADDAGTSFADSFDEGSAALTGETQTHISDRKQGNDGAEGKETVPGEIVTVITVLAAPGAKADTKARSKTGDESGGMTAPPVPPASAKGITPSPVRGIATTIDELRRHSGQANKNVPTSGQVRLQGSGLSSKEGENIDQKSMPALMDEANTAGTQEQAVAPQSNAEPSAMTAIPDNGAKQTAPNLSEILNPVRSQEVVPSKTTIESHDKNAKTEKKEEKPVGIVGNAVGAEAVKITNVPFVFSAAEKNDSASHAIVEDARFSVASVTSGKNIEKTSVAESKVDKSYMAAGNGDRSSTKVADFPSVKEPATGKTEADAEKMAAPAVKAADRDNAEQKAVPATGASAVEMAHIEPGSSAVAFGGLPFNAAVHAVTAKAQTEDTNPHAASVQGGSGAIDPSGPMDAPHKTLVATPTTLEVGVANGTHGWLKIRAEMTGGGAVNASLSTATSSGQEMLHRELPSLTAYLQGERVAVNTVVVQPTIVATEARGHAGEMNGSGNGQSQQGGGQGGENRQATGDTLLSRMDKTVPFSGHNKADSDELLPLARHAGGGSWLSVRA